MMKLIDELKANSGNMVKVGAMNGFFFIGSADDAITEIDKINDNYICNYKRSIQLLDKRIQNAEKDLRNDINAAKQYVQASKNKDDINKEHLAKAIKLSRLNPDEIKAEAKRIRKMYLHRKKRLADHLKTAERLLDREVTESYNSILGHGRILIVDGIEEGKYWFPDEYEADNQKIDL